MGSGVRTCSRPHGPDQPASLVARDPPAHARSSTVVPGLARADLVEAVGAPHRGSGAGGRLPDLRPRHARLVERPRRRARHRPPHPARRRPLGHRRRPGADGGHARAGPAASLPVRRGKLGWLVRGRGRRRGRGGGRAGGRRDVGVGSGAGFPPPPPRRCPCPDHRASATCSRSREPAPLRRWSSPISPARRPHGGRRHTPPGLFSASPLQRRPSSW